MWLLQQTKYVASVCHCRQKVWSVCLSLQTKCADREYFFTVDKTCRECVFVIADKKCEKYVSVTADKRCMECVCQYTVPCASNSEVIQCRMTVVRVGIV